MQLLHRHPGNCTLNTTPGHKQPLAIDPGGSMKVWCLNVLHPLVSLTDISEWLAWGTLIGMTPLHTVTPQPSPWLRHWSQNFEKLFALSDFFYVTQISLLEDLLKNRINTLIGLLVFDSYLTAVKASWPSPQTDDKYLTNEKVSKQFPTSSSLCECGISTWPTSQSSPHSTKLYGINHSCGGVPPPILIV